MCAVDPKTMASKLCEGLYFAGEVLMWTPAPAAITCRSHGRLRRQR